MLPVEVYDAPAAIALLYVAHRKRRHLRPPQGAAKQHGDYGAVAQPLGRRDIRRVEKRLRLFQRQPVAGPHADGPSRTGRPLLQRRGIGVTGF